jgi:predicted Zn-dependent peptidase
MPVLGTNQTVSELSHQALTEYHQRLYRPSRAYFVSVGNLAGKNIAADITRQLADLAFDQNDEQPPLFSGPGQANLKVKNKATDQTHLVLNTIEPKFALSDRHDSYVGVVLNAVLGAGMSSRLFTHIREQKGLAYAVGSTLGHYEDTGTLSVYAGLNTEKIGAALLAIEEEFQKLQAEPVGEAELNKAQELVCGHYDLSADQPLQLANWYGTNQLLGMRESYDEAKTIVRAVTAAEIQKMAQRLFQKNKLSLAVIGPFQSEQLFADFLGLPHSSTIK